MSAPYVPEWMVAFDSDWSYYVSGHDESALLAIDDPAALEFERLWMRPIRASQCEDYGLCDDDPSDTVLRDPGTGRFVPRIVWIECRHPDPDSQPFIGARYRRERADAIGASSSGVAS